MSPRGGRSLAERYHAATCYTPEGVGRHAGLDYTRQPQPFKHWHQARRVELEGAPAGASDPDPGPLDAARLGRLLYHTYGVTLVREYPKVSMRFRAAPSAGGLYPAELYVAVRDIPGIPDGILDYQALDHSLVVCWEGDFFAELSRYALAHPAVDTAKAVLITTGVFERSAWRYQDRAYRRVLLDTGHVLGNAMTAARADGNRVVPILDFHDEGVEGLLLLDGRSEGALALAAIVPGDYLEAPAPRRRAPMRVDRPDPPEGEWIPAVHQAGRLAKVDDAPPPAGPKLPPTHAAAVALSDARIHGEDAVLETIRTRRSARAFTGDPMSLEMLGQVLAAAYRHAPHPEGVAGDLLTTWVIAHRIPELAAGVYRYDPAAHSLGLVRGGDARQALWNCCLRQELGHDCAFAVVHTLHLPSAVERLGERAYRTAHLEAGMLGQWLTLAAIQLGCGASGIGGFFDEFIGSLLSLDGSHATAYITTIGVPRPS